MKTTIKQEVIEFTLKAIKNRPDWILPLYPTINKYGTSYEGTISNQTLHKNKYEYVKVRDLDYYIYDKNGKQVHGNKGVFIRLKSKAEILNKKLKKIKRVA